MRLDTEAQSSMGGMCMQMSESIETGTGRAIWTCWHSGARGVGRREGNLRVGAKAS